jgi:predicted metal-binding membrane protein
LRNGWFAGTRFSGEICGADDPHVRARARMSRQERAEGKPFAPTGWFTAGYFLAWTGFSLAATTSRASGPCRI